MLTRHERFSPVCLTLLICLLLLPAPAMAAEDGEQIMEHMDRALTSATDQFFQYEMLTSIPGKSELKSVFTVHIKGASWRRLRFESPGDIKGMGVLILSLNKMFVYLPAYRKVRRVASHVRDQGFMGSAFSHDDMSVVTYSDKLTARLISEDRGSWTVEATRKEGSDYRYPRLLIKIRKTDHQPEELTYFNRQGVKVKSEQRAGFECVKEHCNPRVITLTDHVRGVTSTLTRKEWKVNTGVADSFFSVRALLRGR